ncbi:MAG: twin-arginine translocase subunit TatC [Gemmatimonadetes bacterium]|nr:twin-arginine translocase subunit TatC [Gemmatimonadota bacterium]
MARERNPRGEMPFLEHLEELRWRILWALLAMAVGTIVGLLIVFNYPVLDFLLAPIRDARSDPTLRLIYLSPADPFFITMKLGIYCGLILSFPIVVYHIWAFLSPALEKREKRAVIPALYLGLGLFIAGAALAYFIALPVTLAFFQAIETEALQGQLEINATIGFVVKLLLAFGAVFELPVVIMGLSVLGLVTPAFLRSKRRHAIVIITILASFLTPGDIITLTIMMMVPLIFLYELGIILSVGIYRGKKRRAEEYAAGLDTSTGAVEAP